MMHLVDTVEVEPRHVADYLDLIRTTGTAVMTRRRRVLRVVRHDVQ